jgi:hypothetical protein
MKPNRVPTIRELQPEALARDVTQAFSDDLAERLEHVGAGSFQYTQDGPLYQAVLGLARYARGEKLPPRTSVDQLIARLSPYYSSVHSGEVDPLTVEPPEPKTALGVAIQGARARAALEAGEPLSGPELALLLVVDRDYVSKLAALEEIPGTYRDTKLPRSPYRFRATKALREWMEARGAEI